MTSDAEDLRAQRQSPMARSLAMDQLRQLAALRDEGLMTEDEFQEAKRRILVEVGLAEA